METYPYVIVGGGVVAGYAAKKFAEHSQYHHGDLAIITADDTIPYDRPPLSKNFLQGYEFWGDTEDADEVIQLGDFSKKRISIWCPKDNKVIGAFLMNCPD